MELDGIVSEIRGFSSWKHSDKIKFFAWFIHSKKEQEFFTPADIASCYDKLKLEPPSSIHPFLSQMEKRKPKEALRNGKGYFLEKRVRDEFESKYGRRDATVMADKLLTDLPAKFPDSVERAFLDEALICFRHRAFRAAIVMTWNLAFHHLREYVIKNHLAEFNGVWQTNSLYSKHPAKGRISKFSTHTDFAELRESEVIEICRTANIISQDINKILREKLDRRNTAAHPSSIAIAPHTAEEFIIDLITNSVLKLV